MPEIEWLDGGITAVPGFLAAGLAGGIKAGGKKDMALIHSPTPTRSAAVFTSNQVKGAPVQVSMEHARSGAAQAILASSGCSNVCTGERGVKDAREMAKTVADLLHIPTAHVLIAATGVIGVPLPMDRVRGALPKLVKALSPQGGHAAAEAIMTTDTRPKEAALRLEVNGRTVTLGGIAKGVGMIEPDMATLITLFVTDAEVGTAELDQLFRRVIDRTFNALSIDTDTSTSDTAAILAGGAAGPVVPADLEAALHAVALSLTRQVARDGEGATTLIEVRVDGAADDAQSKRVAKGIVNSPLVKTAVHGADPNWGRVAMAVGKCSDDADIDQERVVIRFGGQEVYPRPVDEEGLSALSRYMKGDEVLIHVSLGIGDGAFTVYGCDLSDQYVRINADYTT